MNEEELIPLEVTVSITMSKTTTLYVNKKEHDLKKSFREQTPLPNEWYKYLDTSILKEEMKDWIIDDLEVIKE